MLLWLFPNNPMKRAICIGVSLTHLAVIGTLLISPAFKPAKPQHRPLIVKTVTPRSTLTTTTGTSQPSAKKSKIASVAPVSTPARPTSVKSPKQITQPQLKKAAPTKSKVVQQSKPVQKKVEPLSQISPSLAQELEEGIAKIEKKTEPFSRKNNLSQAAPLQLEIDAVDTTTVPDSEGTYVDFLTSCLRQSLHLPEFGEVKLQLTLRQDGTVAKLIVLKTESQKNKSYLETNLPRLRFPRLEGTFANDKEHAFILTFCNEV